MIRLGIKVAITVPFFNCEDMFDVWTAWINDSDNLSRFSELGVDVIQSYEHGKDFPFASNKYPSFRLNVGHKGDITRFTLDHLDMLKYDYIIHIDGDGQIPFRYIFSGIKALTNSQAKAFCGCRGDNWGISDGRVTDEVFELLLISKHYGVKLPDGQCGFWGFSREIWNNIDLSASRFELELDFLTELLEKNIPFVYIPITIQDPTDTSFTDEDRKLKLKFLQKKLKRNMDVAGMLTVANDFNLPKDRKELIESLVNENQSISITCDGGCSGCMLES